LVSQLQQELAAVRGRVDRVLQEKEELAGQVEGLKEALAKAEAKRVLAEEESGQGQTEGARTTEGGRGEGDGGEEKGR
jgi:predicted  nucleic acid-binding Zn-ribbon protein